MKNYHLFVKLSTSIDFYHPPVTHHCKFVPNMLKGMNYRSGGYAKDKRMNRYIIDQIFAMKYKDCSNILSKQSIRFILLSSICFLSFRCYFLFFFPQKATLPIRWFNLTIILQRYRIFLTLPPAFVLLSSKTYTL